MVPDLIAAELKSAGARVRASMPWWLRPVLEGDVAAITIGRRIYVSSSVASVDLDRLLRHELVHIRQIARHGVVAFYVRYAVEYLRNRLRRMSAMEAYRAISFEREAFEAEDAAEAAGAGGGASST